ncbi:hypothetical protein SUGI_0218620 [Cryptomeria japonica]|nr:hypothetical protein SUGI_0218620 [Cryptomeria japonica]
MLEDGKNLSKELPDVAFVELLREPDGEVMSQVESVFVEELSQFWDEDRVKEHLKMLGKIRKVTAKHLHKVIVVLVMQHEDSFKDDNGLVGKVFYTIGALYEEDINLRKHINVCIPGCRKSKFIKYASNIVPKVVYTSEKNSFVVGLTTLLVKEPEAREFHNDVGALMMDDSGIYCIDELDQDVSLLLSEQYWEKRKQLQEEWQGWVNKWQRLHEERFFRQTFHDGEASDEEKEYKAKVVVQEAEYLAHVL